LKLLVVFSQRKLKTVAMNFLEKKMEQPHREPSHDIEDANAPDEYENQNDHFDEETEHDQTHPKENENDPRALDLPVMKSLPSLDDDDETSPRTSNLMLQFSQVLSGVGDDDDDVVIPRREDLFTPPQIEKSEPLFSEVSKDENEENQVQMEAIDFDIWEDKFIPPPPEPQIPAPTLLDSFYQNIDEGKSSSQDASLPHSKLFESIPNYKENFTQESRPVELVVSKIPEEIVRARHREVEAAEAKIRDDLISVAKVRERDLLWREHQARTRVELMETSGRQRLENEAEKLYQEKKEREQLLGRQFRRAKEDMESFLAKQEAHLQEVHGEIIPEQVIPSPLPDSPSSPLSLYLCLSSIESWSQVSSGVGEVSSAC
jgi:hypothetical protein